MELKQTNNQTKNDGNDKNKQTNNKKQIDFHALTEWYNFDFDFLNFFLCKCGDKGTASVT